MCFGTLPDWSQRAQVPRASITAPATNNSRYNILMKEDLMIKWILMQSCSLVQHLCNEEDILPSFRDYPIRKKGVSQCSAEYTDKPDIHIYIYTYMYIHIHICIYNIQHCKNFIDVHLK